MEKKRFEECFAKQILSTCFPDVYGKIEVRDKPDLWCVERDIGIEVTNCTTEKEAEVLNLWLQIKKHKGVGQERNIERLKQLGCEYQDILEWGPSDFVLSSFYRSIEQKIERLNSPTANYKEMQEYHLFINSMLEMDFGQQFRVENRVREILRASQGRTFSAVHILTRTHALYTFYLSDKHPKELHFYNHIHWFAKEAIKECRGEKDEQT
ncbi:MAG: hypothetical protein J5703_03105 [Methanomicrobium sp.]|nr:hypothetical protein [Methanomicrobium sp.]